MLRASFCCCVVLALATTGCGDDPAPGTPPPATNPPGTPPATTAKKPGKIAGSIRDERGNVITIPGVAYDMYASGKTAAGENQSLSPPVKADGTFEVDVALGNWRVSGQIKVPWNGVTYTLPLAPVQVNNVDQPSSEGIVQDFIWKLSGPNRENPDPDTFTHWYGGAVNLIFASYREDLQTAVPYPADGTKYEWIFTPKQPKLIDGSDAKVLKIERTWGVSDMHLTDIPLGVYELTGFEVGATRTPIVFQVRPQKLSDPYVASIVIDFPKPPPGNDSPPPFYEQPSWGK